MGVRSHYEDLSNQGIRRGDNVQLYSNYSTRQNLDVRNVTEVKKRNSPEFLGTRPEEARKYCETLMPPPASPGSKHQPCSQTWSDCDGMLDIVFWELYERHRLITYTWLPLPSALGCG
ncbi:hypothetical protein WG66_002752 [Moniliophthora roreri]|nr:hypothetical protein WG66_002752 [Moniliophthora roreri]